MKLVAVLAIAVCLGGVALGDAPAPPAVPTTPRPVTSFLNVGQATRRSDVRVGDRVVCGMKSGAWVATVVPRPAAHRRAWAVGYNAELIVSVSSPLRRSVLMSCKRR